jgi:hypothetical protein
MGTEGLPRAAEATHLQHDKPKLLYRELIWRWHGVRAAIAEASLLPSCRKTPIDHKAVQYRDATSARL